jgi:hypothetical protein
LRREISPLRRNDREVREDEEVVDRLHSIDGNTYIYEMGSILGFTYFMISDSCKQNNVS